MDSMIPARGFSATCPPLSQVPSLKPLGPQYQTPTLTHQRGPRDRTPMDAFTFSDLEAGVSGVSPPTYSYTPPLRSRRRSYKALSPSARFGSGTPGFFFDSLSDDEPHHFLDSCFLCKKSLSSNRDIFMYRGDTPFCSEECRQEQIEMDESNEKSRKLSSIKDQKQKKSSSPSKAQNKLPFRPGTVVAG